MTLRVLWSMAVGCQRARRKHALDVSQCVGASFGSRRVEWEDFVRTGRLVVWDRHPIPMTPDIAAEVKRLKEHERRLNAQPS